MTYKIHNGEIHLEGDSLLSCPASPAVLQAVQTRFQASDPGALPEGRGRVGVCLEEGQVILSLAGWIDRPVQGDMQQAKVGWQTCADLELSPATARLLAQVLQTLAAAAEATGQVR